MFKLSDDDLKASGLSVQARQGWTCAPYSSICSRCTQEQSLTNEYTVGSTFLSSGVKQTVREWFPAETGTVFILHSGRPSVSHPSSVWTWEVEHTNPHSNDQFLLTPLSLFSGYFCNFSGFWVRSEPTSLKFQNALSVLRYLCWHSCTSGVLRNCARDALYSLLLLDCYKFPRDGLSWMRFQEQFLAIRPESHLLLLNPTN